MFVDISYFDKSGIRKPGWNEFKPIVQTPLLSPFVQAKDIDVISSTDKYFSEQIRATEEQKKFQEQIKQLSLEERVRYESQKDFLKSGTKLDLDKIMQSFRHSTEIYDRLKDMLSPVILSQYGVIQPSLQNPTLHLNEFIKSLFGTDKDFINPPSQELLRIL